MTREEKIDRLDGVFAWDMGCYSSGIKDDDFKASLRDDADGETDELLTAYKDRMLPKKSEDEPVDIFDAFDELLEAV